MKACFSLVFAALCLISAAQTPNDHEEFEYNRRFIVSAHSPKPKDGFVPDKETAISIARAVALPVYGRKLVDEEQPFRSELKDGVWMVLGTMHCDHCVGGTLVIEIDKTSGKVLFMTHTQ
jgi:hypothetical protein